MQQVREVPLYIRSTRRHLPFQGPPHATAHMERELRSDDPNRPALRLQSTIPSGFTAPSLSPSSRIDEGYSDETRSQPDKDVVVDNIMMLPDWVLAQSETDRAGKCFCSCVIHPSAWSST